MRTFFVGVALSILTGCSEVISYDTASEQEADVYVQRAFPCREDCQTHGIWSLQISSMDGRRSEWVKPDVYRFSLGPGSYRACYVLAVTICGDFTCGVVPKTLGDCSQTLDFEVRAQKRYTIGVNRNDSLAVWTF
jgi:uncharacterized protein YceK